MDRPQLLIARKRDGHELSKAAVEAFVDGVVSGAWTPGQTGAMLMAMLLRGMSMEETTWLTMAMLGSGEQLDLSYESRPVVDKHSTGGVGDKVSLVLAPLAAACGLAVPMLSGRGLGHTGGTLDKLDAIPGFRSRLSSVEIQDCVRKAGCVIAGQTERLVPADRTLYSMRDETATVESLPLITASILSKKLAEDLDALLLDVKFGCGAFMADQGQAEALGRLMVQLGKTSGCRVRALLTRMDAPLGRAVGNAVEVAECIAILNGAGSEPLIGLIIDQVAHLLTLAHPDWEWQEAHDLARRRLADGSARARFAAMLQAQGADVRILDEPDRLPKAALVRPLLWDGTTPVHVAAIDARAVAELVLGLGAGRRRASDEVDPATGLSGLVQVGESVQPGGVLADIHAADAIAWERAAGELRAAIQFSEKSVEPAALIAKVLE